MGKKEKRGKASEPESAPIQTQDEWVCDECGQDNESSDAACCACEEPRPSTEDDPYKGYMVGLVLSAAPVPNKDKLKIVEVDVGGAEALKIVTNAPNVKDGVRVVVATVGSKVVSASGEEETVERGLVGGVTSHGMLCNGPMLGWKGGDNKAAATLPDEFAIGSKPPSSRPRKET